MYPRKEKKSRTQFNFPNPQRQHGGFNPQPYGQQRQPQPSMFGQRQPQQRQPQQPIPEQPTNDLQNEIFALQEEINTLKQIIVDSDKRFTELQNQVIGIIEHLNQAPQ